MSDDLPPYTVDTRENAGVVGPEILVYKLDSDKWGKPFYVPSAIPPMTNAEARALALALLYVTTPEIQ